jgi:hypothetical protein
LARSRDNNREQQQALRDDMNFSAAHKSFASACAFCAFVALLT